MIDRLIDPILAPFRALRSLVWGVKQAPNSLKGELSRARGEVGVIKSDFQGYGSDLGSPGKLKGVANPVRNVKPPAKAKMNLFGKKPACASCGQKLHPSWDECPYCGWKKGAPAGAAAVAPSPTPAAPGTPQRTMAFDLGAGGQSSGVLGWFIPLEGGRIGELIELRGRVTVGKSGDNSVVIEDPSISGHHCEFVGSPAGFKLNDLGSTNGTFVNDKRVTSHDLVDNDNVKLGKVRFKFKSLN